MLKSIIKVLLGLFLLVLGSTILSAQPLLNKTKATDYSDDEIVQMINKAESAGLSENQIVELAKARGMSTTEIEAFRERVAHIKSSTYKKPLLPTEENIQELRRKYGITQLKPGITGWAQVNGRDIVSDEHKVVLERYYLRNRSTGLSLKILWRTVVGVLRASGVKF